MSEKLTPFPLESILGESQKNNFIECSSVVDFIQTLNENLQDESRGTRFYFRGESSFYQHRTPTLYRNEEITMSSSEIYYMTLLNEFGKNNYQNGTELFQTLSELQHYEAKTRMLDITLNPLVALYFATYPSNNGNNTKHKEESTDPSESLNDNGYIYIYQSSIDKAIFDSDLTTHILSALNFIPRDQVRRFILHTEKIKDILVSSTKPYNSHHLFNNRLKTIEKLTVSEIIDTLKNLPNRPRYLSRIPNSPTSQKMQYTFLGIRRKHLTESVESIFRSKYHIKNSTSTSFPFANHSTQVRDIEDLFLDDLGAFLDATLEKISTITRNNIDFKYPLSILEDITQSHIVITAKATDRIRQQNGAFIYPKYPTTIKYPRVINEIGRSINNLSAKKGSDDLVISIPNSAKESIRKELELLGITSGYIYADIKSNSNSILKDS